MRPRKPVASGTRCLFVTKMNVSAANLHAANPPGVAIPEALALPVAATGSGSGRRDIGRATVIAVAGSVVTGAVSVIARAGSNRAADDGAADQSAGDSGAQVALRVGRGGRSHGRN